MAIAESESESQASSLESEVLFYSRSHNNNKLSRVSFSFFDSLPVDAHTTRPLARFDSTPILWQHQSLSLNCQNERKTQNGEREQQQQQWNIFGGFFIVSSRSTYIIAEQPIKSYDYGRGPATTGGLPLSLYHSLARLLWLTRFTLDHGQWRIENSIFGYQ